MRTSLIEIRETERFLTKTMEPSESALFQANMLLHPGLRLNVRLQQKMMQVILLYHRRKIKRQLKAIHAELMSSAEHTEFQETVREIFAR